MVTLEKVFSDAYARGVEHRINVGPRPEGCLSGAWAGESASELLGDLFDLAKAITSEDADEWVEQAICDNFEDGFESI